MYDQKQVGGYVIEIEHSLSEVQLADALQDPGSRESLNFKKFN